MVGVTDGALSPAVQLFIERARSIEPAFTANAEVEATIAELCERLDGMPLAIELAAARVTVMSPAELIVGLDDRFQLLSGGRRRQRQRTLEATSDWSYQLLDAEQQRVFRALGVFVGGFDLAAVGAVTELGRPAVLDTVEALVAKSLVVRADRGHRRGSRCSKRCAPTRRTDSHKQEKQPTYETSTPPTSIRWHRPTGDRSRLTFASVRGWPMIGRT